MTLKNTFKATKTYRYFTLGEVTNENLFIALHGYGQLAPFFIRKFDVLKDEFYVIAPEGPHRFYLSGSSGRVGASWMTKEDRMDDIEDNLHWLTQLFHETISKKSYKSITLLGFSQGAATAARWLHHLNNKEIRLIIWASVFPPDLIQNETQFSQLSNQPYFALGNQDEYYNSEEQQKLIEEYKTQGFTTIHYEGNHTINQETLLQISREIVKT